MEKRLHVHFIGLGGIGISALARYYLSQKCQISGSDLKSSEITDFFQQLGAQIIIGQPSQANLNLIKKADLVVYSPAIPKTNQEFKEAKKLKKKILSYPQALGELTKDKYTIAVSGTHGKSTTTALLGWILVKAGLDPTVVVGTKVQDFGDSNFRLGRSNYWVIEADEYQASFLNYWPQMIILTNIAKDHLDYYKNFSNIIKAFKKFITHLPPDGFLVLNYDDKNIQKYLMPWLKQNRHYHSKTINVHYYSLQGQAALKVKQSLTIPGWHNVANALAAKTAAQLLKVPDRYIYSALKSYQGAWRRFETHKIKINQKPLTLILDYAHHPQEIEATYLAAKEKYPHQKIYIIFQPHQRQRTKYLFTDFVKVFKRLEGVEIIIIPIFEVAGRERIVKAIDVSSEQLVEAINKPTVKFMNKSEIMRFLINNLNGGEVVIIMGAGDIYNFGLKLLDYK